MSFLPRARRSLVGIITAMMLVVACGSDGDDEAVPATTAPDQLASAENETVDDDTTVLDTDQGAEDEDLAPSSGSTGPVAPLTGLSLTASSESGNAPGVLQRAALLVKVDNHPRARPQTGLDQADLVFDFRAEGVTRFAAVFHSTIPDPVGPVRSSRTSDFDLLRGLDTPIYASSGGNDYVTAGLRELPIIELTNRTRNEYFRDLSRPAPHNLFIMGSDLYALAPEEMTVPEPWFTYRADGEAPAPGAVEPDGPVTIRFTGSPVVTHTWDQTLGGWLRTQDGAPHLTADGEQLAPENVVIMITEYRTSPADATSPEVVSVGSGEAVVLTDGQVIEGRWERPTAGDKPTLTTLDGDVIALSPGRTWILMPEAGQVSYLPS